MSQKTEEISAPDDYEDSIEDSIEIQDQIEKLKEEKKQKIKQDLNDEQINQEGIYIEGQIKRVKKISRISGTNDVKITLSFIHKGEKKTETILLEIPQKPEDYKSDKELVRLINYLDVDDRRSLVGRYVPLKKIGSDKFELDIPSNSLSDKIEYRLKRKLGTKRNNLVFGSLSIMFITVLASMIIQPLIYTNMTNVVFVSLYILASMVGSFTIGLIYYILRDIFGLGKNITDIIYSLFALCFSFYFYIQPQSLIELINSGGMVLAIMYFNSLNTLLYMSYNSYKKIDNKEIKQIIGKYKKKLKMIFKGPEEVDI